MIPRPSPVVPIRPDHPDPDAAGSGARSRAGPSPVPTAPERRYMASANVPGPALAIPGDAGAGGCCSPRPRSRARRAGARVGTGVARGAGEGVTSFARPLGGYQTTPHYPESARRQGAEGSVTLRFEVLTSGKVGTVQVQRSAGRADLDRAASEAIQDLALRARPSRKGGSRRMGHPTGTLRAERPLSRAVPRFTGGHHWTAVGLAFCAIASAGTAAAQGIWDDPAFSLYRQAVEAMDKKDYAQGQRAERAGHRPAAHPRARPLRPGPGRDVPVALGRRGRRLRQGRRALPGSFAAQRDLGGAYEQLNRVDDAARDYEAALAPARPGRPAAAPGLHAAEGEPAAARAHAPADAGRP